MAGIIGIWDLSGGHLRQPTSPPAASEPKHSKTNANPSVSCQHLQKLWQIIDFLYSKTYKNTNKYQSRVTNTNKSIGNTKNTNNTNIWEVFGCPDWYFGTNDKYQSEHPKTFKTLVICIFCILKVFVGICHFGLVFIGILACFAIFCSKTHDLLELL